MLKNTIISLQISSFVIFFLIDLTVVCDNLGASCFFSCQMLFFDICRDKRWYHSFCLLQVNTSAMIDKKLLTLPGQFIFVKSHFFFLLQLHLNEELLLLIVVERSLSGCYMILDQRSLLSCAMVLDLRRWAAVDST